MGELISIITPAYNCSEFIGKTIESIQSQTYENWEMIIVNDCSTDNTMETIKKYSSRDSRIKIYCLKENAGGAVARTKAIEEANGEFIAFLDSDDMWKPEKLEKQLKFMKDNKINFCCTQYEQIDELGNKKNKIIHPPPKASYYDLLKQNTAGNSTVMYNAVALGKFKVPDIRKRNDLALWLQILKKEKYIYAFNENLTLYRIREGSVSGNKLSLIKYHWKLYHNIEKLCAVASMYYIGCVIWNKIIGR